MKSFKEFISEISTARVTSYMRATHSEKETQGREGRFDDKGKDRSKGYALAGRKKWGVDGKAKVPATEETISEVEAPRSELDKKVFADHPVKVTDVPYDAKNVFKTTVSKDKSRKADKEEPNNATGGLLPSEDPLYEPQTLGSRQKIMQYFKYESKQVEGTPIEEDVNGTYRASFYGQLKRRMTKNIVPAKQATQSLTTKLDIDDPKMKQFNGNEQGIKGKEVGAKSLAKKVTKTFFKSAVNEVSYDRLRRYMDKNDDEYNRETDKDNPYDGNTRKRENRSKGFSLATNKRTGKNVKVPSKDE